MPRAHKGGAESEEIMLSERTYERLQENGREKYAPMLGKTYRHVATGYAGVAVSYTLCGQLILNHGHEYMPFWANECEEVKA